MLRLLLVNLGNWGHFWNEGLNLYPYIRLGPQNRCESFNLTVSVREAWRWVGRELPQNGVFPHSIRM